MCQCDVDTAKLQTYIDFAGACSGNTDYYPGAREVQGAQMSSSCCLYYMAMIHDVITATDAEYDNGPTNPLRYCSLYEGAWAAIQEETSRCTDAAAKAVAEEPIRDKLDFGGCQVE